MSLDRIVQATADTPLIVRDSLSRQQWEAVIAAADQPARSSAWPSRPVWTWSNWLRQLWETAEASGAVPRNRFVLSPQQTDRLWRNVIEESEVGKSLIGSAGVAGWARLARRQLFDAGVPPERRGGALWPQDARVFLDWNQRFEDSLNANDWIDPDTLLYRLNQLPVETVAHPAVLLDPPGRSLEAERLVARWKQAGYEIDASIEPGSEAVVRKLVADDPRDELRHAADWAAESLAQSPEKLYGVVIPDLDSRHEELQTLFADRLGADRVGSTSSTPVADISICGAALNALRLLAPEADFDVLSRWLRSPFFERPTESPDQRAVLEIKLRSEPRAQQDFSQAWRGQGLRDVVARKLPGLTRQIDRAFSQLPLRATPTTWTAIWQACLKELQWHGIEFGLPEPVQRAWDNAWGRFAALTAVTGPMSMTAALDELLAIARQEKIFEPLPLRGLLLSSRIDQVGPGFAGAWITGFTDDSAHTAVAANPLLPWSVQAAHRLPGASPESDLEASLEALRLLRRRVPVVVFSCPDRVGEQPQTPSPLLRDWRREKRLERSGSVAEGFAASRVGSRAWCRETDEAPPLDSEIIRGGTRTLDLQALCPVKAFCVARLGAEPLEAPLRGIDPRIRGILIHRVLELLLDPAREGAAETRIDASIESALSDLAAVEAGGWRTQVEAERTRLTVMVNRFLEVEGARAPFTTVAVEQRKEIELDGSRLRCRIDRVDRLAEGAELIVDYKTGRTASAGWFEPRLTDCQLPLYAQEVDAAGVALIRLDAEAVEYRGAGMSSVALPSGFKEFDSAAWSDQVSRWLEQLIELVREFQTGDVRIREDAGDFVASDAKEHAGGAFAPLSRAGDPS
jgi:probable DNA repair protein